MSRDKERLERVSSRLDEEGIDYMVVLDPVNIRYLAGATIDYSACIISRRGETILVVPPMEYDRSKQVSWVDQVYRYGSGDGEDWIKVDSLEEAVSKLVDGRVGLPYSYVSHRIFERLSKYIGESLVDCDNIIRGARSIKTAIELDLLSKAVELVESGIQFAYTVIREGVTESRVSRESLAFFIKRGADKVYDDLIVASGPRSAYPHGRASDKVLRMGEPITLDYVAAYEGYWGDVTRTVFMGEANQEIRKIYEVVEEALYTAIDKIYAGVEAREVDKAARSVIEKAGYGKYFIHSTGHGLGLEIHEAPRLSSKSGDALEENMVVTVEPGIYVTGLGGVRIENDVVVTSGGARVLNRLPTELIIL